MTALIVIVVGVFFARALIDNWTEVQEAGLSFSWLWIVATVLFAAAVPVSGLLWGGMVRSLSSVAVGRLEAIAVHCLSWLLKYVPGQVGSLVNKVLWGQRRGISRTLVGITFVYENVFLVLAATVPSVIILFFALGPDLFGDNLGTVALPLVALIPLIAISNRWVFRTLLNPVFKRVAKQAVPKEYFLSTPRTLLNQLLFVVPRVMNGAGFVVIAVSLTGAGPDTWAPLAAAYMLAGAAGILAILVPSGIGVREAVIVLFAAPYLGVPQAIIAALLSRLLSTIGDGIVAAIYAALRFTLPPATEPAITQEPVTS